MQPNWKIALTGATGFLGRYIAALLSENGNSVRAWYRPESNREALPQNIEWLKGELGDRDSAREIVRGCDAVVHSALHHPGGGFRKRDGDLTEFIKCNLIGSIQLIEEARAQGVKKFVFISTCAVHDVILADRPLDETHPLWMKSHYGAHKAAIEAFVHSYGLGHGFDICALRPTGIYGAAHPVSQSKWFPLIKAVAENKPVSVEGGGKEVHAHDVARAVKVLLESKGTAGQCYNCYDIYISEHKVAQIAKRLSNSSSQISGNAAMPKNQIVTDKIRGLGLNFGGEKLLESTIAQIIEESSRGTL